MDRAEREVFPLSAVSHYVFCPRRCALIHIEGEWSENFLTAAGQQFHTHVDSKHHETRRNLHLATTLRLNSERLGLTGVADVVEFHLHESATNEEGEVIAVRLPKRNGFWRPYPVEYKRGKPKAYRADEVQLCAQALCLEEMLSVTIHSGALFYGETRRRMEVSFDEELRTLTLQTIENVHALIKEGETPSGIFEKKCKSCSLVDICRPKELVRNRSAKQWLTEQLNELEK